LVVLFIQTIRRRWVEGGTVLLWFALPLVLISAGTSKLYHYAYPFLPPAALAGGYLVALVFSLARLPIERGMWLSREYLAWWMPRVKSACDRLAVRTGVLALAVVAVAVATVSLVHGPVRITIGGLQVFKSSGVLRPGALVVLAGILTGAVPSTSRAALLLVVASLLPLTVYRDTLARLDTGEHPMRDARDCILRVVSQPSGASLRPRGLWVDGLNHGFGHEHYFYFRKVQPWTVASKPSPDKLAEYMYDPAEQRPMLVLDSVYQDFLRGADMPSPAPGAALPPMVSFGDVVLIVPGPYAVCGSEVAGTGR
jgi:4-amino-4-deoxy-L-arabinose transferase-like glycosyltransferase